VVAIDAFPDTRISPESLESIGEFQRTTPAQEETTYAVTVPAGQRGLHTSTTACRPTVTFVTKETETVLYIPNRAITRENGTSYVLCEERGAAIRRNVESHDRLLRRYGYGG
jgi:hypothetical protein